MDAELENAIESKCPILYANYFGNSEGVYIECGNGWYDIIDKLSSSLELLNKIDGILIQAFQIKEKFGTLRFYYDVSFDEKYEKEVAESTTKLIDLMISNAEKESAITCEECGKKGKLRNDIGWIKCLCNKHYKEQKKILKKSV